MDRYLSFATVLCSYHNATFLQMKVDKVLLDMTEQQFLEVLAKTTGGTVKENSVLFKEVGKINYIEGYIHSSDELEPYLNKTIKARVSANPMLDILVFLVVKRQGEKHVFMIPCSDHLSAHPLCVIRKEN